MSEPSTDENPLSGLRVLELGHVVAAPYATLMLADLGAEVVKVEHPDHGDHMRVAGDTARAIFSSLNRDKLSVTLDLASTGGRDAFLELVEEADVVVENFSPGALDRLDLEYTRLNDVNESLIHVSIKGFSADGPYGDRPATDPIIQAMSGLMSVTGYSDRPPVRSGTSVIDFTTAQNAVVATLLAVRNRRETGTGQLITVPMFRTAATLMSYWMAYRQQFGVEPERNGASHSLYAPYDVYPTGDDGYVFIGAASDDHWEAIEAELGLSLGFETRHERLEHREVINEAIESVTAECPRAELVDRLLSAGVPAAPVNELSDVLDDPHLDAVGALTRIDTNADDDVAVPFTIPWVSAPGRSEDPPELGADTDDLLG